MTDDSSTSRTKVPMWQRWLPGVGTGATVVVTFCCLGLSAVISLATSVGATFLTRDSNLKVLLAITLVITVAASVLTFLRHRNPLPLVLTVGAGVLIYWALYGGDIFGDDSAPAAHDAAPSSHDAPDEHAADSHAPEAGGGHGSTLDQVLVWIGLVVLVGAQVWDVLRVRALRRGPVAPVA